MELKAILETETFRATLREGEDYTHVSFKGSDEDGNEELISLGDFSMDELEELNDLRLQWKTLP